MEDPETAGALNASEAPDAFQAHGVVARARAAGIGPSLTDDELYRALQAVHLAAPDDRPSILTNGPLWASLKTALDVAGALASILGLFR